MKSGDIYGPYRGFLYPRSWKTIAQGPGDVARMGCGEAGNFAWFNPYVAFTVVRMGANRGEV